MGKLKISLLKSLLQVVRIDDYYLFNKLYLVIKKLTKLYVYAKSCLA